MSYVVYLSVTYVCCFFFFFKQKTAYEMRISDWSSDVCSSDLIAQIRKKRIPRTSIAKELSRIPQNKSDAETGLEVGKHTWRGLVAGVMSARKDAEAQKDAKLAEELEEARQAQKELDRREKDDADSQDKAKKTVDEKAETREQRGKTTHRKK